MQMIKKLDLGSTNEETSESFVTNEREKMILTTTGSIFQKVVDKKEALN